MRKSQEIFNLSKTGLIVEVKKLQKENSELIRILNLYRDRLGHTADDLPVPAFIIASEPPKQDFTTPPIITDQEKRFDIIKDNITAHDPKTEEPKDFNSLITSTKQTILSAYNKGKKLKVELKDPNCQNAVKKQKELNITESKYLNAFVDCIKILILSKINKTPAEQQKIDETLNQFKEKFEKEIAFLSEDRKNAYRAKINIFENTTVKEVKKVLEQKTDIKEYYIKYQTDQCDKRIINAFVTQFMPI